MKKLIFVFIFIFVQACTGLSFGADLVQQKEHSLATLDILKKLQTQHYEKKSLDDALSQSFLDSYLEAIDANRMIFLQRDIDSFRSNYGTALDDLLRKGDVSPGFAIFNIYRDRSIRSLERTITDLPNILRSMDYSANETMELDRSETPWPTTQQEVDSLQLKRIKAAALSLKLANKSPEKILELLTKRQKSQLERLKKINSEDVYQIYINAFTELYDPHTNYLSPAASDNFDIEMSLKLEGIGAMLSQEDEYTVVTRLVHAGPAEKQGVLKPSDKIIGVAQGAKGEMVDVVGWRLDDVVDLIRGKKGSTVRLEVIPAEAKTDDQTKVIAIVRDEVKLEEQAVQKAIIEIKDAQGVTRKIGVIDIPTFYIDFDALRRQDPNFRSTTRDTAQLFGELMREGAEGFIIDLRDNGGGSLREANQLTSLFIEQGPSVQIRQADLNVYAEEKKIKSRYYSGPLIVLTNRMSASASEIFAGAMQDYKRAIIVGSTTFGKGTVQSLIPLPHGKLKITESKFYRISGESTQHRGVVPDIELPDVYDSEDIGESALDNAMKWDTISPVPYKKYGDFKEIIPTLAQLSRQRAANDPEFIYLNKKISYEKSLVLKEISLNEKKRLEERQRDREYRLKLENQKRIAKGEKALKELDDDEASDVESISKEDSRTNEIDKKDPYLNEAAKILLDMQHYLHSKSKVTTTTRR